MDLSALNRNFLATLKRLDIDFEQFPDKSFDGLFDNIPEDVGFFFNWFIENITSDNVLTQSEQATYFQLESSKSLLSEEEVEAALLSCNPGYDELMSLDVNYVISVIPQDLDDLKTLSGEFSTILENIQSINLDLKKKQNFLEEKINSKKNILSLLKDKYKEGNSLFGVQLDKVKAFISEEPNFKFSLTLFNDLRSRERNIYEKLKIKSRQLENEIFHCSDKDILSKLEEDLICMENAFVVSEGVLKEKKTKIDVFADLLKKKSSENSFNLELSVIVFDNEEIYSKVNEEIRILEKDVFEKGRKLSHLVVQKILEKYFVNKIGLIKSFNSKLAECKDHMKSCQKISSCLLHILSDSHLLLENTKKYRRLLNSILNDTETKLCNDVINLEQRRQRFKEVSAEINLHPLLVTLKNLMSLHENPIENETILKNIIELYSRGNNDPNFVDYKFRNDLQSSVKLYLNQTVCSLTSQLLFEPVELLVKFHKCKNEEVDLNLIVKRLTNKYVNVKETISKSNRKKLLLWIQYLTDAQTLITKVNNTTEAS